MTSGPARPPKARRLLGPVLALALIAGGAALVVTLTHSPRGTSKHGLTGGERRKHRKHSKQSPPVPTSTGTAAPPSNASGPLSNAYRVSGSSIVGPNGSPFTPYGLTIFGLADSDWTQGHLSDLAAIPAIANYWHGNTVRIQVAPDIAMSGSPYNTALLSDLKQEVSTAESNGLNVILCAQYERTIKLKMPNQGTMAFWQLLAQNFGKDGRVWFDLFNEPQLSPNAVGGMSSLWDVWQNGGDGYVGMQSLVNSIRAEGAGNLLLAEGVEGGKSLAQLSDHLLTGDNIAYAVHPYFEGPAWSSPTSWEQNWGFLVGRVAIVADEWSEYQRSGGSCTPEAPTLVPQFLAYLSSRNIGLIGWGLIPGVLIRGNDLESPTAFTNPSSYNCHAVSSTSAQGAGQLLRQYFLEHSSGPS
jgi:hypothetical protein